MKFDPVLNKAIRLARSKNYEGAVRTLESEDSRYSGSFSYYYIFAVVCLNSGDFGRALTYFRLAREIKMRDPNVMLGLAVLYMRRGETGKAVDFYLDVKELDPKNKIANRGLSIIRKYSDADSFSSWLDMKKLPDLYPPIPSPAFELKRFVIPCAIAIAAFILIYSVLVKINILPNLLVNRDNRRATEFILTREERNDPVQIGGSYRYILTRNNALDVYDKALALFTAYRDEAAKVNLNRILESNASDLIKNKSRLLISYMEVPGFDNFNRSDNASFSDVAREPALYRDVHVIWRGMATNIEIRDEFTGFDFLVGYDTRRSLEGIVHVVFDKALSLNSERPLEVLGRIVPLGSAENAVRLEGVAIYQSGRLEE
jgi:tetratricopeptide (TPR) repeat protein